MFVKRPNGEPNSSQAGAATERIEGWFLTCISCEHADEVDDRLPRSVDVSAQTPTQQTP